MKRVFWSIAIVFILFNSVAEVVWQYHNPKANALTFWTHYGDVIRFKSLEEFQ